MFDGIRLTWWGLMMIGFGFGVYAHCALVRHWLHWLVIKILRGFIWLLQRSDQHYHKEQKVVKTAPPIKGARQDGFEVDEGELSEWLSKNPQLSVSKR